MAAQRATDWRLLAEQTSNEMDSARLAILVAEPCRLLDDEHDKKAQRLHGGPVAKLAN
jgi:hypothetical protein